MAKTSIAPVRRQDYLYDENFTVSGAKDHARAVHAALDSATGVVYTPSFPNMFSALRHYPADSAQPVPVYAAVNELGNDRRVALVPDGVTGTNRPKYFTRPNLQNKVMPGFAGSQQSCPPCSCLCPVP